MKSESHFFNGLALFLFATAAVYYIYTDHSQYGADWIGTTAMVLSGALCGMCGLYFAFIARRLEPRPEDRLDGEVTDGAGEVGFFSPGSYWPIGVAASAALLALGLTFVFVWLIIVGVIAVLGAVGGLLFEYYTSSRLEH